MPKQCLAVAVSIVLLGVCGCATNNASSLTGIPRTSSVMIDDAVRGEAGAALNPNVTAGGIITLQDAATLAMKHNPELTAAAWEAGIKEAEAGLAGVFPNPELELETEEFGGSGSRRGLDGAEVSIRLGQLVELGGKRSSRIRAASLENELSRWDYEIKRQNMLVEVAKAYINLLAAQEKLVLARESERLVEQFVSAVSEQVRSGKDTQLEQSRAQNSLMLAQIKSNGSERALSVARKELSALWGETEPSFDYAVGDLEQIAPVPEFESTEKMLARNPELSRWATAMEFQIAQVNLEKAYRIPDVIVSGGTARFMEDGENALVVGLSFSLPILDRNQWNILRAERELAKAREERRAEEILIAKNIFVRLQELASAYEQAHALVFEVVPISRNAREIAEEGYHAGKFSYFEVLDAQRAFFEAREQAVEVLVEYHIAITELERISGEPFSKFSPLNR